MLTNKHDTNTVKNNAEFIAEYKQSFYLTTLGGSRKNIAKKIIPNVPTSKKVYTNASINIVNKK